MACAEGSRQLILCLVRPMQRVAASVFSLLMLASARADTPIVKATVQQLLEAPEAFHKKRVEVTGYHYVGGHECTLYASKRASDHRRSGYADSIWISLPLRYDPVAFPAIARPEQVEGRRVRVIGTFHYQPRPILGKEVPYYRRFRGYGTYNMWARALRDTTYLQPAK